jgi:hypothetical protein
LEDLIKKINFNKKIIKVKAKRTESETPTTIRTRIYFLE